MEAADRAPPGRDCLSLKSMTGRQAPAARHL